MFINRYNEALGIVCYLQALTYKPEINLGSKQAMKPIFVSYRPPCILIIGLPVRVMDTSSCTPRRCMNGAL